MLIYLPERVYYNIKNNPKFISMVSRLNKRIVEQSSSLEEMHEKEMKSLRGNAKYYYNAIRKLLTGNPELIQGLRYATFNVTESNDALDVENKLIALDNKINSVHEDLHGNEELYYSLIDEYFNIFNSNTSFKFSELIYANIFMYNAINSLRNIELELKENLQNFKDLIDRYERELNTHIRFSHQFLCNYTYLNNMLIFQKKLYLLELFKLLKQNDSKNSLNFDYAYYISKIMFKEKFKYEFNYVDFLFMHELFLYYFDRRNFPEVLRILDIQLGFIEFTHLYPQEAYKSLSYHSDSFTPNFLSLVSFYKILIEKYLTSYRKTININIGKKYFNPHDEFFAAVFDTLKFLNLFIKEGRKINNGD